VRGRRPLAGPAWLRRLSLAGGQCPYGQCAYSLAGAQCRHSPIVAGEPRIIFVITMQRIL
jgi:hypothetical protein